MEKYYVRNLKKKTTLLIIKAEKPLGKQNTENNIRTQKKHGRLRNVTQGKTNQEERL